MPSGRHRNRGQMTALALSVAGGGTIARWATDNNVPRRTCYEWTGSAEFKALVERIRSRALDRAAGRLSRSLSKAVSEMTRLISAGENGAIRLAAAKAVTATLIEVQNHATKDREWAELMARVEALEGNRADT
jgi:hypothetical protein